MTYVAIASDHAGRELKDKIVQAFIGNTDFSIIDNGTYTKDAVDYPVYAEKVINMIRTGFATFGILCCGSGEGMCIAANKHHGIRCSLGYSVEAARLSRSDNNCNIIAFGGRTMADDYDDIIERVKVFLTTPFDGGRHQRRLDLIEK